MSLGPRTKPPATGLRYGALNGPAIGLRPGVILPAAPLVYKPVPQTEPTDGFVEQAWRGAKRLNNWFRERVFSEIPSEIVDTLNKIDEGEMFRPNESSLKNTVYTDFVEAVINVCIRGVEGHFCVFASLKRGVACLDYKTLQTRSTHATHTRHTHCTSSLGSQGALSKGAHARLHANLAPSPPRIRVRALRPQHSRSRACRAMSLCSKRR